MSASVQLLNRGYFEQDSTGVSRPFQSVYAGRSYLFFVWAAVALGAVAIIEPSPSDVGIALLLITGFLAGNLQWFKELALPFILLGLFLLSNAVSSFYVTDVDTAAMFVGITIFMLLNWLFVVGVLTKFKERGLTVLMSAYTVGGVASTLIASLCYFGILPLDDYVLFYDRIKGFFKDPNVFGPYLVIGAVYSVLRLQSRQGSRAQKIWWLFACLTTTVGVLLCFSRAAWANYALTLFTFFALNTLANRKEGALRRNIVYFVVILTVVGATVAYAMTIPQVAEVITYRTEMQSYDEDRFATHEAAMELGMQNPLGVGPGQSFAYLQYATHNLYLRAFSENGMVGIGSLLAFMLVTLVRSIWLSQITLNRFQRSIFSLIAAAIFGTLLNSFAIDTLHWRHFWFLLALGWMPVWAEESPDEIESVRTMDIEKPSFGGRNRENANHA